MASIFLLLLLSTFSIATSQQRNSNMSLGSFLSPSSNSSLLSPSGHFAFGFYPEGNGFAVGIWFAGVPRRTVSWTANRDDPPVSSNATLVLNSDGRLVLQQPQGQNKVIANASVSASWASILDSGNFVLYSSALKIIWQSFNYPTDTLLPGQLLPARHELVSSASESSHSTGSYRLKMQHDGNLVMYPVGYPDGPPAAYWAGDTWFAGDNATLTLNQNGLLYVLNTTGINIKNISDGGISSRGKMFRATIDPDGIWRLYSNHLDQNDNWTIEWSKPDNRCDPKGLCGINAYCVLMDQDPACTCPPGFIFISQEQRNLGCNRNFSTQSCVFKNGNTNYVINELDNIVWEDSSYSILMSTTKEGCKQFCLEDCNCEAALFQNQVCRKQKLPLRFGKRNLDDSTTILVKVGVGGLTDTGDTPPTIDKPNKKELRKDILITGIASLTSAFIILTFSGFLVYKHRAGAYKEPLNKGNDGLIEDIVTLRSFSYDELKKATNGFKEKLGRGGFGTVFKGVLANGQRTIAVKRLEKVMADEGEVEFRNEMRSIGRTHHRNLVRLIGYCNDGSNRLLVYEYMSNGSLANFLFKSETKPNWNERIRIILDIARGILYLHEECNIRIIHCDINPNNILLDEYHCAKIADFGLAKLLMLEQTRTLTGMRGTRGYVASEWHKNLPITVKADVYSFGIVLLEVICCRKCVDMNVPEDEAVLADWVYNCFEEGELRKLVREEEVDEQQFERMVRIGLWCIHDEPSLRPTIKNVVLMLEGTLEIPNPPSHTSFHSAIQLV